MIVSRREFMQVCRQSAIVLGLSAAQMLKLEEALANPLAPSVVWLQGSSCTGCSVSFLNRISTTAPKTAADVLITALNLQYHPNLMAPAGQSAAAIATSVATQGGHVLVVEGGVPTAFNGNTCWAWSANGRDVTFLEAVQMLASKASAVVCVGTCASWGGVAAASPNPTAIRGVKAAINRTTINIAGCPPHPDWIVWALVQLLTGARVPMDSYGRPTGLFSRSVHDVCPRREREEAHTYGLDGECMKEMGCLGPATIAPCPQSLWNGRNNWCVDANSQCLGCTNPNFPITPLRRSANGDSHDD